MTRDARFWRNVTIVGLVHVVVLLGLLWRSHAPKSAPKDIVWMEGGAGGSKAAAAETAPETPAADALSFTGTPLTGAIVFSSEWIFLARRTRLT